MNFRVFPQFQYTTSYWKNTKKLNRFYLFNQIFFDTHKLCVCVYTHERE